MRLVLEERLVDVLDASRNRLGLVRVEDRERARQPEGLAVNAKSPVADAVKGAAPEPGRFDPVRSWTRWSISLAALLVKVSRRMSPGRTPWERSQATR